MAKKSQAAEIEIPDIVRREVKLPVQCGGCIFYRRMAVYPHPCVELGTAASADPCRHFVADPHQLGPDAGRVLRVMAAATKPVLLAAAMMSARRVARTGFTLGQQVFVKVFGDDYVCNYASGVVVGAAADRVAVSGAEGYAALLFPATLLSREAWQTKLASLIRRDRINDPAGGLRKLSLRGHERLVAYEPAPMRPSRRRGRQAADAAPRPRRRGAIRLN